MINGQLKNKKPSCR